jgi:FKBP-type peptidyl-prolyl cis-trans isomerase 2
MARLLRRDEDGLSTLWSFVLVLVIVIAILGVYYGYLAPKFAPPPLRAQSGDQVAVDYVGTFTENGLVFDTSEKSVAQDNASYPKAFMFAWHSTWQPLPVTVGSGGVVKGFDLGIQGLAVGESKTIVVPAALGYGSADPSKIFVKPLLESVPVRITMNASDFFTVYKAVAVSGTNVTDPFWGWSATVSVSGSLVTVTNSPVPNQIVNPYGAWNARVVSIDDGANQGRGVILVRHLLDANSVDRVGLDKSGTQGSQVVFVVTAVDLGAQTYTLNYNTPTKGRTLVFQVTMLGITRLY